MALFHLKDISISYGADPILDHANLIIEPNERIGLIGRNGAGKSTLLKLIEGEIKPDGGEARAQQGIKISRLIQEVPNDLDLDIQSVVAQGHPECGEILSQFYQTDEASDALQQQLNESDAWLLDVQVKTVCSKFNLDPKQEFSALSGGMKRRVMMARALVNEPDILLLDEPTNHLDIDTILWLEGLLVGLNVTLVLVSHDRSFIDKLCTRIIELDRGALTSWPGNYQAYLTSKAKALEEEERHNALFDKRLAQEETWIRQGIKARRTRNEGRVRALKKMREERSKRREQQAVSSFGMNQGGKSGKIVIEIENIHAAFDDRVIIEDFSCRMVRGDKIGIIGANGCGKSTLIKILTEQIEPQSGTVKLGTNLDIAYLDQHRSAIQDNLSVQDNVSGGSNDVTINGQTKHIMSYLQDFLFSPERARAPAAKLSGGERNRLMLAKLFTQPFNFLILDEPTNDLDYETLELLEQLLMDYSGTLLLVSHDRTFLNNVVTSTIAFEGNGVVNEYIGGYDDWLRQSGHGKKPKNGKQKNNSKDSPSDSQVKAAPSSNADKPKKLSYKLQRELEELPKKIDKLENDIRLLHQVMGDSNFYSQDASEITKTSNQLKELEQQLDACFARWEELDA